MKKRISILILVVIMVFSMSTSVLANATQQLPTQESNQEVLRQTINPRADVFEYKYRVYNDELQRRLWNSTKGWWVGDWETISIH